MSADCWATCPACVASGAHAPGDRPTFREDWELGLNDAELWGEGEVDKPPVVILNYTGQCQVCGLEIKLRERFPVSMPAAPVNKPTGFVARKPWSQIPAGWFVQAPRSNAWYEVKATRAMHSDLQLVTLADPDGKTVETRRPRDERVPCCRGTLPGTAEVADALDLFGEGAQILEDEQ